MVANLREAPGDGVTGDLPERGNDLRGSTPRRQKNWSCRVALTERVAHWAMRHCARQKHKAKDQDRMHHKCANTQARIAILGIEDAADGLHRTHSEFET